MTEFVEVMMEETVVVARGVGCSDGGGGKGEDQGDGSVTVMEGGGL